MKSLSLLLLVVGFHSFITEETMVMAANQELCVSETKTFTVRVNLYAGELGSYHFEECGLDKINPHIAMEIGETYTFVQKHRTNYFHPLGFAYSPYGDEELKIEVEPGISKGDQDCIDDLTCVAPMYMLNDEYLGKYSNIPEIKNVTSNEEDFGLDVYEPLFFHNPHEWTDMGTFNIKLKIDDDQIKHDLFYFCHIHEFMGGRIKLTKNGEIIHDLDTPDLGYEYDTISEFDEKCGTYGLGDFELPNPLCPNRFVCGLDDQPDKVREFSECIDAMNCAMMSGMTTGTRAESEPALFIHQMIPHHQNAVNMAKALMKTGSLKCDDLADDENPDCVMEAMLYEIVNNQNLQIQAMYDYLDARRLPEKDNCDVYVETVREVLLDPAPGEGFEQHWTDESSSTNSGGATKLRYGGWGSFFLCAAGWIAVGFTMSIAFLN